MAAESHLSDPESLRLKQAKADLRELLDQGDRLLSVLEADVLAAQMALVHKLTQNVPRQLPEKGAELVARS
jgi:hypothetical protein